MRLIVMDEGDTTPRIELNPETRVIAFRGVSYPENALGFYRPVLSWIEAFLLQSGTGTSTRIDIDLKYMNTSTTRVFMRIFDLCEEARGRGAEIIVNWFYKKEDTLAKELGEDLSEGLGLTFNFIAG